MSEPEFNESGMRTDEGLDVVAAADAITERRDAEAAPQYEQEQEHFAAPTIEPVPEIAQRAHAARQQIAESRKTMQSQVNAVDLDRLRQTNPGQFAATMSQIKDASEELQRQENAINQWEQQATHESARNQHAALANHLARANQHLESALPDWRDPDVRAAETAGIREYAINRGYSDADLDAVYDPRIVLALRDAWQGQRSHRASRSSPRHESREYTSRAEAQIERQRLNPNTVDAAALRIAELMGR